MSSQPPALPQPSWLPTTTGLGAADHPPSLALPDHGFADVESGIDWRRVFTAVARFKWLILAVTLLGSSVGVAATRFLLPQYLAKATIWIEETDRRGAIDRGPIRPRPLLDPESWADLPRCFLVRDQGVRDQRLFFGLRRPAGRPGAGTLSRGGTYHAGPD